MKKLLLIAGVLLSILLTACSKEEAKEEIEEVQPVSEVVLYEGQGLKAVLKASVDVSSGAQNYVLAVENISDTESVLLADQWVVNEKIVLDESESFYMEPGAVQRAYLSTINEALLYENQEMITSLQFHMMVRDENYEEIENKEVKTDIPGGLVPSVIYDTFLGAKAEEQVLLENEKVKATLLGWGAAPEGSYVRGVVCFENKSKEQIPVMVSSISINGRFFTGYDRVDFLNEGESCYGFVNLLEKDIQSEGIESVTEVRLLLLTDESQNTGLVNYDGGEWYDVVLSEKGEETEEFTEGELLDIVEDVNISLVEQSGEEWSSSEGGYYKWKLAVVNNNEENIEVSEIDILLDGIPVDEWEKKNGASYYSADNEVGAGSNRYINLNVSYEEKIPRPELRFRFQIRSMAGGAVIGTGTKEITITPDTK